MKKNILLVIVTIVAIMTMSFSVFAMDIKAPSRCSDNTDTTISEEYIPSEASKEVIVLEVVEVERVEPATLDEANIAFETALQRNVTANNVYEGLIGLGYDEKHPAVVMALTEVANAEADCEHYEKIRDKFQEEQEWAKKASEYPVATQVWLYMKNELGWSDIVCSGIMGNLMAECGGCWTSDLNWRANGSNGLGMVQWIGGRRSQLVSRYGGSPSVEDQLNFIKDELYGTNGVTKQVTDSQLNKIMNASSPEECAYAFACYYERCGESHRAPRRGYARTAYEYFVG